MRILVDRVQGRQVSSVRDDHAIRKSTWWNAPSKCHEHTRPYPALFSPFRLGSRVLRNRIVHASMNTHMVADRRVTEQLIHYHGARLVEALDRHHACPRTGSPSRFVRPVSTFAPSATVPCRKA
jgi:hypothetical protein